MTHVSTRFWLTAAALIAAVYFWVSYQPNSLTSGNVAPNFSLQNQQGHTVSLQQFQGKVILLHFWATWCGTCVDEIPELTRFISHFKDNPGFVALGLSLDDAGRGGGWEAVQNFAGRIPLPFTVLMDKKGAVADQYGTYALPETYLIDRNGLIVRKWVGSQEWARPKFIQLLESEISKNPK